MDALWTAGAARGVPLAVELAAKADLTELLADGGLPYFKLRTIAQNSQKTVHAY